MRGGEAPRVDVPAEMPLPPVPAPAPESAHRSRLRESLAGYESTLQDAARLCAIGGVLADGAAELRPCMSAQSAKVWMKRHADDVDRAYLDKPSAHASTQYGEMRDLREAVVGAAAELDEAGQHAPALVSALYAVVKKIERAVDRREIDKHAADGIGAVVVLSESLWSRIAATYYFGLDALALPCN